MSDAIYKTVIIWGIGSDHIRKRYLAVTQVKDA